MIRHLKATAVLFLALTLTIAPSVSVAQSEGDGGDNTVQADSSMTTQSEPGSSDGESPSWFKRLGGELDLSAGVMLRLPSLTAGNIDVKAGILGERVVDFSYERPLVKTNFSTQALAYQENSSHGIKKYTFGVDTGPIFRFLIPGELPFLLRRILSMRFRTERELLQTQEVINENVLFVTEDTELSDSQLQESDFTPLSSGSQISRKRRYNYFSADIPIFYFNSREYDFAGNADDAVHVDRLPGDQQSFLWIGTGIARWNFISTTKREVSDLGGQEVMFSVDSEVWAVNLEATFKSTHFEIGETEHKFSSITRAGYGFAYRNSNPHVDIERLVGSSADAGFGTGSKYLQTTLGWGVNLLSGSGSTKLYVTPRVTYREIGAEIGGTGIFFFRLNVDLTI